MGNGDAYVSVRDFKKLEQKVDLIMEAHASDRKLTKKEKSLVKEGKKDIKRKTGRFVSLEDL
ncbi:MAG: hypothetical protein NTY83_02195 [Candidatus Micrarchaeota archaeon]|nr:hypothetical protein [Candidatus Micrarchaeota archaeon]